MFLDTNIIMANFASGYTGEVLEKNIKALSDAEDTKETIKISKMVVSEVYHLIFKRIYKKISRELFENKEIEYPGLSVNQAMKNPKIIGRVNSIVLQIFELVASRVSIEIDYVHMLESIQKFKISPNDFCIALEANNDLITGDEDLNNFLEDTKEN